MNGAVSEAESAGLVIARVASGGDGDVGIVD